MQGLFSRDAAEILGKRHDNFAREIRKYIAALGDKATDYFKEVKYVDKHNRERLGYEITYKGCEFIAGRLLGVKSERFKAEYEALLSKPVEPPKGYTTEEVAKILGCSRRTVQRIIRRGELFLSEVTVMIPKTKLMVTPEELARYRRERREKEGAAV